MQQSFPGSCSLCLSHTTSCHAPVPASGSGTEGPQSLGQGHACSGSEPRGPGLTSIIMKLP